MTKAYDLIIFDMDGTLADRENAELLDGVRDYFTKLKQGDHPNFALATNQGGVGLRLLMQQDNFGEPEKFPTEADILAHIDTVIGALHQVAGWQIPISIYKCFAYKTRRGDMNPIPPETPETQLAEWHLSHRKPNAGMLLDAMSQADVAPQQTLMVGDRPEDKGAAHKAQCDFMWAWEFFGREQPTE